MGLIMPPVPPLGGFTGLLTGFFLFGCVGSYILVRRITGKAPVIAPLSFGLAFLLPGVLTPFAIMSVSGFKLCILEGLIFGIAGALGTAAVVRSDRLISSVYGGLAFGTGAFLSFFVPGLQAFLLVLSLTSLTGGGALGYIMSRQPQDIPAPPLAYRIKSAVATLSLAVVTAGMFLGPGLWNLHQAKGLVESGADLAKPLHDAAVFDKPDVADYLLKHGAKTDARDDRGCTSLHMTALNGNARTARVLLAAGADVDAQCDNGDTPLHMAVTSPQTWAKAEQVAALLVQARADPAIRNAGGETALRRAADNHLVIPGYSVSNPHPLSLPIASPGNDRATVLKEIADKVARLRPEERRAFFKSMRGITLTMVVRVALIDRTHGGDAFTVTSQPADGVKVLVFDVPARTAEKLRSGDRILARGRITGMFYNTRSGIRNSGGATYYEYEGDEAKALKLVRIILEDGAGLDKLEGE